MPLMPEVWERWVSGWTGKVISVWATTVWPDGGSWWPFWKLGGDSSLGSKPAGSSPGFFSPGLRRFLKASIACLQSPVPRYTLPDWFSYECVSLTPSDGRGNPIESYGALWWVPLLLHLILHGFSSHNTCLQTPLPPQSEVLGAEAL